MSNRLDEILLSRAQRLKAMVGDRAIIEARLLLSKVLKLSPVEIIAQSSREILADQLSQFDEFINRRLQFEPMAYLLGEKEFLKFKFKVGPGVLIPRPETESLVLELTELLEKSYSKKHSPLRVIDLGTGSGCIVISLKKLLGEKIEAIGIDRSKAALAIAKDNAREILGTEVAGFQLLELSWKNSKALDDMGKFDLVVSNPPYIPDGEWDQLQRDIRDHEPKEALLAGPEGLDAYREILSEFWLRLNAEAYMAFETYDAVQRQKILSLIPAHARHFEKEAHLIIQK